MTTTKRYLTPQQYFNKIEAMRETITSLQAENTRLRYNLNSFISMEFKNSRTQCEQVQRIINEYFEVNINHKSRRADFVDARRLYYWWCRKYTPLSLKGIAQTLDLNHDHATIIFAIGSHEDFMLMDKPYRERAEAVLEFINMNVLDSSEVEVKRESK